MISDGELQEGSNWEAFLFASHNNLNNLTVIIDHNNLQDNLRVLIVILIQNYAKNTENDDNHISETEIIITPKINI